MDIYFTKEYGESFEQIEGGVCDTFDYINDYGEIHHLFIKRPIPLFVDGKQYYDLITPYGYGGPLILHTGDGSKEKLCQEFGAAFGAFCIENNIVSEFVRFHPIICNAQDFREIYNPSCIRKTLGTNLAHYDDPVQSEFSKGCRKSIRQALNKGITYKATEAPDNIDSFIEIYNSTMIRDNAEEFYYFEKKYFDTVLRLLKNNILYAEAVFEEKTIAAGLYFISDGVIHVHLSGTLSEYLQLSPSYILKYGTAVWGKEHGFKLIHYGGGTSNAIDDPLFLFKKKFANNTEFDFFIAKKIWNSEIYTKLCQMTGHEANGEFFPAYRTR